MTPSQAITRLYFFLQASAGVYMKKEILVKPADGKFGFRPNIFWKFAISMLWEYNTIFFYGV